LVLPFFVAISIPCGVCFFNFIKNYSKLLRIMKNLARRSLSRHFFNAAGIFYRDTPKVLKNMTAGNIPPRRKGLLM